MQFSKIFLVAATVASAAAAPVAELETRTAAPIKCQHHGGKWKYGWEGAADNEKYTCNTAGLLNILTCVNILNGNSVNVDLLAILGL